MMQGMIDITVQLAGSAADAVGDKQLDYSLAPPVELGALAALLYAKHPKLADQAESLRFSVNGHQVNLTRTLAQGDEVVIAPQET